LQRFIDNLIPWFGDLLELGGGILTLILLITAVMWALIAERLAYLRWTYPAQRARALDLWNARTDRESWFAQQFRNRLLSRISQNLRHNVPLVRTMIRVCPLLGLLGTVLGMLEVFDAVASTGGNSPRATAAGVSKATITTLAGLLVSISGLLALGLIERRSRAAREGLEAQMPLDNDTANHTEATTE
jgi:biopolymer transport protein ExbB